MRDISIRLFSLAVLLVFGIGLLAACGQQETGSETPSGTTSSSESDIGAADELPANLSHTLWLPGMNVFRRHNAPADDMFRFYRDVLGFEQLGTFDVAEGGVTRFRIGPQELKLTQRVPGRQYVPGGIHEATGLRLLTFHFPEALLLAQRFRDHGLPEPEFEPLPNTDMRSAIVQDPDGQWLQLIVAPGREAAFYEQIEIGLTVSDLDSSQRFYANFVGLQPMRPQQDPVFNTMKHSFRHGSTTITLRHFGDTLPADTGSGGIQYVVSRITAVERLAEAMGVSVDQPLSPLEGFDLLTIWLEDPDGITNYFAQTAESAMD